MKVAAPYGHEVDGAQQPTFKQQSDQFSFKYTPLLPQMPTPLFRFLSRPSAGSVSRLF